MADPLRCPACDEVTEPDPPGPPAACQRCGRPFDLPTSDDDLPFAADLPERAVAIPVRPPRPRPEPPPLITQADAAWGIRWLIIAAGLMVVGSCLLFALVGAPALPNAKPNPAGLPR